LRKPSPPAPLYPLSLHDALPIFQLTTDEGLTGLGEATTSNRDEAVVAYLEGARHRHVLGSDPFNLEDLWARVYRGDFVRSGTIADRKSTRLNSSHLVISYAVFCL